MAIQASDYTGIWADVSSEIGPVPDPFVKTLAVDESAAMDSVLQRAPFRWDYAEPVNLGDVSGAFNRSAFSWVDLSRHRFGSVILNVESTGTVQSAAHPEFTGDARTDLISDTNIYPNTCLSADIRALLLKGAIDWLGTCHDDLPLFSDSHDNVVYDLELTAENIGLVVKSLPKRDRRLGTADLARDRVITVIGHPDVIDTLDQTPALAGHRFDFVDDDLPMYLWYVIADDLKPFHYGFWIDADPHAFGYDRVKNRHEYIIHFRWAVGYRNWQGIRRCVLPGS